nr:PAS domain S-box protein [Candidatus Sigynarchaeota archaeon]
MDDPSLPKLASGGMFFEIMSKSSMPCLLIHELKIEWVNEAVEHLTGFKSNELIGKTANDIGEFVREGDSAVIDLAKIRSMIYTEDYDSPKSLLFKFKTRDNELKWVKFTFYSIVQDNEHYVIFIFQDITPIKEQEEKFQLIAGMSLIGIIIQQDGLVKYINPAVTDITGFTEEEMKAWKPYEYQSHVHPDDWAIVAEQAKRNLSGNPADMRQHFFYRFFTKSGELRLVESFLQVGHYEGKSAVLAVLIDATKKHALEQQLVESEQKFRCIAEQSTLGVIIIQDGKFLYANQEFSRILGKKVEELVNTPVINFMGMIPEPLRRDIEARYRQQTIGNKTDEGSYTMPLKLEDGSIHTYDLASKNTVINGKDAILVFAHDITSITKTQQQLKESEEKFRNIAEQSALGIVIVQDKKLVFANKKFADIMESTIDEVQRLSPGMLLTMVEGKEKPILSRQYESREAGAYKDDARYIISLKVNSGKVKSIEVVSRSILLNGRNATMAIALDITDRVIAEQYLKESEEKFRSIAEQSALGIIIIQDRKFVFVNQKFADIINKSIDEVLRLPPETAFSIIEGADKQLIEHRYKERDREAFKEDARYVLTLNLGPGKIKQAEVVARSIVLNGRNATLGIAHDITDRMIAEQDLKESEEKFRTIAEKSLIGIIFMQDGGIKYVNDQAARIFGYASIEMLTWTWQHLVMKIHPDERFESMYFFDSRKSGSDEKVREIAFRIISRDGNVKWIQAYSGSVLYQGKNAEMLIIADITEQKESEIRLKESEEKYHQIFEESAAAILLMNTKGFFIECNSMAERLLNMKKAEIIGKHYKDLQQYIITDLSFFKDHLRKLAQGIPLEPFELEGSSQERGSLWVRVHAARVKLGKFHVNQLVINDITEKKKLESLLEEENKKLKQVESLLEEENKKLKQLDVMRKNFIFTATHELKTPLVSLYGASDFLLKIMPQALDETVKSMIEIIHRGAERLKALVDNLLDVSRMDTGNFKLTKQAIDMVDLVRQCISSLDYLVKMAGQEVVLHAPEKLIANVDKLRMDQVITNLLSNAIKNTPKGGHVAISLSEDGDMVKFTIKDDGVGLTPEEMHVLFSQFGKLERTDLNTAVNIQGSGLGLHISKNIVDMHGGKIWAESEGRNKGAMFSFQIPIDLVK